MPDGGEFHFYSEPTKVLLPLQVRGAEWSMNGGNTRKSVMALAQSAQVSPAPMS